MLTREEFIRELRKHVKEAGSQKTLAFKWGISQQYLTDVLKRRRMPGKKILQAVGYESIVMYKKRYRSGADADHGGQEF